MFYSRLAFSIVAGALAVLPGNASLITAVTSTNALVSFDSATPGTASAPLAITGLQNGEAVLGIDYRPATGQLYGIGSTSRLYVINPATGAATQIGTAGVFTLSGTAFGFDFNPSVDRIRVISNTGQNIRLNPDLGTLAATDTALQYDTGDTHFGATPRGVASAYDNNVAGAATTTLFGIDSNFDSVFTQNPANSGLLQTVGAMGFNTSDLVGFDIEAGTGFAYASMTPPTGVASQLFRINLTTGAATLVGSIGSGVTVTDISLAITVVPEPGTWMFVLTGIGFGLFRFRRGPVA